MGIRSVGYDGAISEIDWSRWIAPYTGSQPTVMGVTDLRVSASTGMSVQVAPGVAHGWGITDVSDAAETLTVAAVPSGTRHDVVVIERNWDGSSTTPTGAPTGGRSLLRIVQGGAAEAIPTLQERPGTLTQTPLALVKVTAGTSAPTIVADLRATHTKSGYARSMLAMTGPPGTRYCLEPDGRRYVMRAQPNGTVTPVPEWEPPQQEIPPIPLVVSGTASVAFGDGGSARIPHQLGRRPKTVTFATRATVSSGLVEVFLSTQAGSISEVAFTVVAKVVSNTGAGWVPYVGVLSYVDWIAVG